jgi:hypothetical protein
MNHQRIYQVNDASLLIVYAGKSKSSLIIIAIAVPISVSMVLFAVGLCFLR